MKRKNILKFVSLLGIGSFVMLAAASCTTPVNPTPNSNPPSDGMKGGDTNPGNPSNPDKPSNPDTGNTNPSGETDAKQLSDAKASLNTLLGSQSTNVALYEDYAKIKATLSSAYTSAQSTANNANATLKEVNDAKAALQTAISDAANAKTEFDKTNSELVSAYATLKETLKSETTNLVGLSQDNYSAIKTNLVSLYNKAKDFITETLDPTSGTIPKVDQITNANTAITQAVSALDSQKTNADTAATTFIKEKLDSTKITFATTAEGQQGTSQQPANYSFVGYSNDLDHKIAGNAGNPPSNLPTWNFAQRKVWTSETKKNGSTDIVESPTSKTDVSWIYSLSGEGTKYTLEFTYYGPSTAYLYFPYKLVKSADSSLVALQYKLNDGEQQPITFAADNQQNVEATANKTPTVSDINVAKVSLSGLKFGSNTIELSVATENPAKVAPMIGNIYITSNDQNSNKVYDDIFGNKQNTIDNKKSVTVDLLTGYSLASSWSTYIGQFTKLTDQKTMYLVGFIGGPNERVANNTKTNKVLFPYTWGNERTFTIYANAPETGQYFISGSYLTSNSRALKFSTGNSNSVTISGLIQKDWSTLGSFDTAKTTGASGQASKTLTLVKGLNKITIATGAATGGGDAPFIGNLTFTLSNAANNDDSTEA